MKYRFVVYSSKMANSLLGYAKEQFVYETEVEHVPAHGSWEITVECSPHQMERIFGYLDCLMDKE